MSYLLSFDFMGDTRQRKFSAGATTAMAAKNLRAIRLQDRRTQEEIAQATGIPQRTVGRYLNGEQTMSVEILTALAYAFNLEPWQLLVPDLDPSNPPVLRPRSKAQAEFEAKLQDAFRALTRAD